MYVCDLYIDCNLKLKQDMQLNGQLCVKCSSACAFQEEKSRKNYYSIIISVFITLLCHISPMKKDLTKLLFRVIYYVQVH